MNQSSNRGASPLDLILVGGGLSATLVAIRLVQARPEIEFVLLDRDFGAGATRTWCFHSSDVEDSSWLMKWVDQSWHGHDVVFPRLERTIETDYHAIRSEAFFAKARALLGPRFRSGVDVVEIGPDWVRTASGELIQARGVLDARGLDERTVAQGGFQKFVGLDVELEAPHGLVRPLVMDASVEQVDGYRFFYVLPWDERRLLIEDTRYSDSERIDEEEFLSEIKAYASGKGWRIVRIERVERGVLPIPFDAPVASAVHSGGERSIGYRGGFFHPVTGYSVAEAVRVADRLAKLGSFDTASLELELGAARRELGSEHAFFALLNLMMFQAAEPARRYRIFQRFYGLGAGLIARFYSGRLRSADRARLLIGRPPVPVLKAIRVIGNRWGRKHDEE